MINLKKLKMAIVYDRVNKFGGAERVLLTLHEMFPDAPLYTSVYNSKKAPWAKVFKKVHTSFLQKLPLIRNYHELMGWLMPSAFERFDFKNYDLVISVTSEAAKGIITSGKTLHVCYLLTPTRYLWSGYDFYFHNRPQIFRIFPFYKIIARPFLTYTKWWDRIASKRPDKIIAISTAVKKRIKKYYGRESEIIFPPVSKLPKAKITNNLNNYYLIVGRFEPYKQLELVINTFKSLNRQLIVAGSGSEFERLKNYSDKNIKFIFKPTDNKLSILYKNAKAFIMPQDEDFGITSLEAQQFGTPVIAYKAGGALDTVVNNKTGIFFKDQSEESLKQAIANFDTISFNRNYIIKYAQVFSKKRFKKQLQRSLVRTYSSWRRRN